MQVAVFLETLYANFFMVISSRVYIFSFEYKKEILFLLTLLLMLVLYPLEVLDWGQGETGDRGHSLPHWPQFCGNIWIAPPWKATINVKKSAQSF